MNVAKQVTHSLRWVAAMRFTGQIISWFVTVIVIRLLSPADYGLMAMATATISIFQNVSEMGMESGLVQSKDNIDHLAAKVFTLVFLIDAVIFGIIFLGSYSVSEWLGEPRLEPILKTLSIIFLLLPLQTVPRSYLRRELKFKRLSIVGFMANMAGLFVTLLLAYSDYGVWALVYGLLVQMTSSTILLMISCDKLCRPSMSLEGMRGIISFGSYVTLDRIIWAVYTQADTFIIGKMLGKDILGLYTVAKDLATLPMSRIAGILNPVAFSGYSRVQSDPVKIERYFVKAAGFASFLTFPIFIGISSVAPEIIHVVIGEKWVDVIFPLQVLSAIVPMQMLVRLFPPAIMGIGRADLAVKQGIIALMLLPISIYIGSKSGISGVVLALAAIYPLYFVTVLSIMLPALGVSWGNYIKAIKWPAIATVLMYLVVSIAREVLHIITTEAIIVLPILIGLGAMSYTIIMKLAQRELFTDTRVLLFNS